jgi:hypothetical protein
MAAQQRDEASQQSCHAGRLVPRLPAQLAAVLLLLLLLRRHLGAACARLLSCGAAGSSGNLLPSSWHGRSGASAIHRKLWRRRQQ